MFGLLVEIDAEIQPVTGRQPVVIPVRNITGMFDASVGFQDNGLLFGYGGGPATAEYPWGANVNAIAELMINAEIDAVPAVILIRKPFSIIDSAVLELAVGSG